jgi:formylglycine-generating enzyme required for sulfatase activity
MDDRSSFPKLTEEEIVANHKQKKKMIKALSKFDSKEYTYVPSSSYSYNGVPVSVQAFHMQRKEVTNLEYRTFLFDLLIQDRKEEFLLAAPDQTLWTKALADSLIGLQNDYFSDHKYNDFPVVNVSQKGVEMYCKWITTETNKTRENDPINDVRIPDLLEWTLAASNLGKTKIYPWEGDQLTTENEFNANFKLAAYDGNLKLIEQKTKTSLKARTTFEHVVGLMIAWSKSYEPNALGFYNMSGNVSEMVLMRSIPDKLSLETPTDNQLITCGGSWMSGPEELNIFQPTVTVHINGHPTIGFRVVITHLSQRAMQ